MSARIYVGRLSSQVREKDLERFFKGHGRLREVLLKNGFGFVEFDDHRDADDAVYELNGKEFCGERVIVEHARGGPRGDYSRDRERRGYGRDRYGGYGRDSRPNRYGPPTRTEYRLNVENLSSRVSWQDLKDYMRQVGEVTYADAHKVRQNEGTVEFATYADMKAALEKLDDTEINGRRIRLTEERPRSGRSRRSRSRSRSRGRRSRSHSRSRSRSRSGSRSRSRGRSRSRSKSRSQSRSRSRSPKSRSRSRSRSRSESKSKSKSRSPSPAKNKDDSDDDKDD